MDLESVNQNQLVPYVNAACAAARHSIFFSIEEGHERGMQVLNIKRLESDHFSLVGPQGEVLCSRRDELVTSVVLETH